MSNSGIVLAALVGVLVILLTISIIVNIYCFMRYKKLYSSVLQLIYIYRQRGPTTNTRKAKLVVF